jgi:5-methylthioadenosine/S-adenosylhomocysteine deaminase
MMSVVLKNCYHLGVDYQFHRGDIRITKGTIDALEPTIPAHSEEQIDCRGMVLIPGLINAHTHNPAGPGRGLFADSPLEEWCGDSVQGRLQQQVFDYLDTADEAEFRILLLKAYGEYLKQGITFIVDSGQADNAVLQQHAALKEIGLSGCVEAFEAIETMHSVSDEDIIFAGHLPEEEDIDADTLSEVERLRAIPDLPWMSHCLETPHRLGIIRDLAGCSTVRFFDDKGLLDSKTVLFHLVHADDADLEILSKRGVTAVYCPISNAWSGAGQARVEDWIERNINIGLGTDFLLSDIWEVMRTAYYRLKSVPSPERFSVVDVFRMATVGGADAFVNTSKRGRIIEGARADLVFIDARNPALWPLVDGNGFSTVLYNILMNGGAGIVKHVMNGGEWVVRDSKLVNVDEAEIDREYGRIMRKLYGDRLVY